MKKTFIFTIDYSALQTLKANPETQNLLVQIFEQGNKCVALYPKTSKSISEYLLDLTKSALTDTP
jgi:hypothetical protein